MLIEKRLGVNEELAIRNNSIVCFEKSVNFHKIGNNLKYKLVNKNDFIIVEGPGLIIFELNHTTTKKLEAIKNFKLLGLLSLAFTIIALVHFLMEDFKIETLRGVE